MSLALDLHEKQLKIFRSRARVRAINAARGFGKSYYLFARAITLCAGYQGEINPKSPKVGIIITPTLVMGRQIHWHPLLNTLERCPAVEDINKSELRIKFKGEKPDLLLRGADRQGDRLRGLNPFWVGCDEFADFHPDVWKFVLMPALGRNADWQADVIGTPKGKRNHFYEFCRQAYRTAEWRYFHHISADNPYFPKDNLIRAEQDLPPKVFAQEHLADWVQFEGAIYDEFSASRHIVNELPSQFREVFLGCDWGDVHPYLSVVGLSHQGAYYVIDGWESNNPPVVEDELIKEAVRLCRAYNIRRAFLPDDRPASVKAFRRAGERHDVPGLKRAVQVNRLQPGKMEGHSIANSLFYQNRLFIYRKLASVRTDYQSFHRAKDPYGGLLNEPAPGQRSHSLDSIRYVVSTLEYKYGDKLAA